MNGLGFFICGLILVNGMLLRRVQTPLRPNFWNEVKRCLRQRDYLLSLLSVGTDLESRLRVRLLKEIRQGRLRIDDLEALAELFKNAEVHLGQAKNLRLTTMTHLCLVILIPLCLRLLWSGRWWCGGTPDGELLLAILGFVGIAWGLNRVWPELCLGRADTLWDFVLAYLGERDCGFWRKTLIQLEKQAWLSGLDSRDERQTHLQDFIRQQSLVFERRLRLIEDSLGPGELLLSAFFGFILLYRPVLSQFGMF